MKLPKIKKRILLPFLATAALGALGVKNADAIVQGGVVAVEALKGNSPA